MVLSKVRVLLHCRNFTKWIFEIPNISQIILPNKLQGSKVAYQKLNLSIFADYVTDEIFQQILYRPQEKHMKIPFKMFHQRFSYIFFTLLRRFIYTEKN